MVWGYIQYGGVREICRVEGNINSLKYQEVLAASYIPNHKKEPNFAAGWCSIAYLEHVWGRMKEEAWKTKPKNLDEILGGMQDCFLCYS